MAYGLTHPSTWFYWPVAVTWLVFIIAVGDPEKFIDYNWLWLLFRSMSPYFWSALGVCFAVGLSILGAAWWGRRWGYACGLGAWGAGMWFGPDVAAAPPAGAAGGCVDGACVCGA